jgi:magnesium chelatase family protein
MMKKILCATYEGLDAKVVEVESTLTKGLPSFSIVGMASTAITESKERVKSALLSNDFSFPPKRITFSLAPSELSKSGSQFDLGIALLILLNSKELDLEGWFVFGELGLDGSVKESIQLYPLLLSLANQGLIKRAIVPYEALSKLSKIPNIDFYAVKTIQEAGDILKNSSEITPTHMQSSFEYPSVTLLEESYYYIKEYEDDFIDVKGQEHAKRAALIAAAGFHNLILEGSPGCGKSMIAKRLQYILPPMKSSEILDVAKLQVLDAKEALFIPRRNMQSVHHTATSASVFGGGSYKAKIGEVGLAHNGILFFDELPHFSKNVLESLREPMQDAKIRISRVNAKVEYPASFLFVGAMNPCPCGNLLDADKECRCSDIEIQRYKNKLSDPFLDRIDLHVIMQEVNYDERAILSSQEMHKQVVESFVRRGRRGQHCFNAHLSDKEIDRFCTLDEEAEQIMQKAIQNYRLSFRSITRVKKVARTIADLDNAQQIDKRHILEALSYRKR